jgi:hypothetical protein
MASTEESRAAGSGAVLAGINAPDCCIAASEKTIDLKDDCVKIEMCVIVMQQ